MLRSCHMVVVAGEQVFDFEVLVVTDAELLEVDDDPAGLLVVRVEVDDDQDYVGRDCRCDEAGAGRESSRAMAVARSGIHERRRVMFWGSG